METKLRRLFSPGFKAEVVLESLRDCSSLEQLALKYDLLPTQIDSWKNEALGKFSRVFEDQPRSNNKEQQETAKLYAKATSDAIWDLDLLDNSFFVSEGFMSIFGYDPTQLIIDFAFWTDRIHQDDQERVTQRINDVINGEAINWVEEFRYLKADNTHAIVLGKGVVKRDPEGQAVRMVGAMQDITRRKKEEQHLKLLESVITNTTDAVVVTEAEPFVLPGPKIIYVNAAFTKMTGYSPEEVIGKTPRMLQGPKTDRKELDRLVKSFTKWESCETTVVNYKKSGEEFWINMSISPVADENGWFTHWISIERDVTERKNEDLQKKILGGEISQLFNQPVALNETLQQVLARLAGIGDFSLAEAWLIGTDQQKINRVAKLAAQDEGITHTEYNSISSFCLGDGIPGTVWAENAVQYLDLTVGEKDRIQHNSSLVYLETVVYGIPIIDNKKVIGAFILGTSRESPQAENIVSILEHVGAHIGTEIKRKQLEQELHQVFNFAPDIIFVAGFDGYFKKINPAAARLLEYSEEELLAFPVSQFMHPEDRSKTVLEEIILSRSTKAHYFENRYYTKSGAIKWLAWTLHPAYEEDLLFGVAKDITTKKEYEEKIKFHANLLSAVGQAVVATDMEGKVIYWNDAAVGIYGWTATEALGTMISHLQTPISGANAVAMQKHLQEGKSWSGEFRARNKSGTSFPALISNSCIQNERGEVIGIIGVSTDITDSKQNELILQKNLKDLAASNEELEQFAYVASHDLQEPLRMVTSFLNKIETKYGGVLDDKGKKYIEFAVDGSKRMRQIILDLLEFSRIGRLEYDHEYINLTDLVEEIKILFRNQIEENKAMLVTSSLPTLQGHKAPLLLVFQNLIGNALKYKRNGICPEIHIMATEAESHWEFSVRDNGIGIDPEYFDKIFIIFQRLHNTAEFSGTGIGLAVTKKIIEKQGGTIWVKSEEGQGSTFYFTLAKHPIGKTP